MPWRATQGTAAREVMADVSDDEDSSASGFGLAVGAAMAGRKEVREQRSTRARPRTVIERETIVMMLADVLDVWFKPKSIA